VVVDEACGPHRRNLLVQSGSQTKTAVGWPEFAVSLQTFDSSAQTAVRFGTVRSLGIVLFEM
jgi:hypothetical protein